MPAKSVFKITHDPDGASPTVLLDFGDKISELVALDGRQLVEKIEGLRVAGIDTAARFNETHNLTISKMVEITSAKEGALAMLKHPAEVPRHPADIKIEIENHADTFFLIKNATVETFPVQSSAHYLTKIVNLVGGQMIETDGTTPPEPDPSAGFYFNFPLNSALIATL